MHPYIHMKFLNHLTLFYLKELLHNYNWLLDDNNNFYIEKIHNRNDYIWVNPVHEVLKYIGNKKEKKVYTYNITVNHYPDNTKSRSNYLSLLEEDPKNDRNVHYLGREYMYYRKWNKSIDTLIKHLNLETATWKDERCASMRFIARDYQNLKRYDEARMWLDKAIKEAPYLRDPLVERALLEYQLNNYKDVIYYCNEALKIKKYFKSYINEIFSGDYIIYDLLSIAYFYEKKFSKSLENVKKAVELNPNNERLLKNLDIIMTTHKIRGL